MKHIFIINPAAGKGSEAAPLAEKIHDACKASGAKAEVYRTSSRGDATEYVKGRIAEKPSGEVWRFYACGGDGTLSEVIGGAVNEHVQAGGIPGVEIGCVPIGTGNDFVRNFSNTGFFSDITKQLLADASVIDCYRCDGILADGSEYSRYGVNMINIGFDCDAAARAAEFKKIKYLPKNLAYIAGVAVTFKENLCRAITVHRSDGSSFRHEFELVSAANGGWCGGGFHSAPRASLTDGRIDVNMVKSVSRFTILRLLGSYKAGTHLETRIGKKFVLYFHDTSIRFDFDEPTGVCIDGEIIPMKSVTMTVIPRALAFAIPVGSEFGRK